MATELFQAQGMTGGARWNYQRLVDLKQPGVILPALLDPGLIVELNSASKRVTGQDKYPALHLSDTDTGEGFGLEYQEPGCRPVPLDWGKHRTQKRDEPAALMPPSRVQAPGPAQAPGVTPPSSWTPLSGTPSPGPAPSSSWTPLSGTPSPGPAPSVGYPLSAGALLKQEMPTDDHQEPPAAVGKLT